MIRSAILPLAVALCAGISAQSKRFLPSKPTILVHVAGPAVLAEQFGATNVGALFEGGMIGGLRSQLEADLEQAPERARRAYDAIMAAGGTFTLALRIDNLPVPVMRAGVPEMTLVVKLSGAEQETLDELAAIIDEAIEEDGGDLVDVEFGEWTFRSKEEPGQARALAPAVVDGELVFAVATGEDHDTELERLFTDGAEAEAGEDDAPIALELDIERGVGILMEAIESAAGGQEFSMVFAILDALGLHALRQAQIRLRPHGDFVAAESTLTWDPQMPMALLDLMRPDRDGPPALLHLVPATAENWQAGTFDFPGLVDAAIRVALPIVGAEQIEMFESQFAERLKVRLREDLLAHIGRDLISVGAADATEDPDDVGGTMAGVCYGVSLLDPAAFEQSLEQVLRSQGLHAARKTTDYRGVPVHMVRVAVVPVHWAIVGGVLLLGFGDTPGGLSAVIDEHLARAAGEPRGEAPEPIAERLAALGDGWPHLSAAALGTVFDAVTDAMAQAGAAGAFAELPPGFDPAEILAALRAELVRCGLEYAVSGFRVELGRATSRVMF